MKIHDVKIIRGTPSHLEDEINRLAKLGYEFHGTMKEYLVPDGTSTILVQAMVKYESVIGDVRPVRRPE